jgi:GT2 family glycosyltransferase
MSISIVCITLVRESLYSLLDHLTNQLIDEEFEVVLVPQPRGQLDRSRIPESLQVQIIEEDLGKGFGFYRQLGLEHAHGEIVVWIDDDEHPAHTDWLSTITKPIRSGAESVVTSGVHIPLGQGYVADGISWLGLPGGGYPGFETMWPVDNKGYTDHLCSGNLAFKKTVIEELGGFNPQQVSGNEDVELGDRLRSRGIKIRYDAEAVVIHQARKSLSKFLKWHVERGLAHKEFVSEQANARQKITSRLGSSLKIIRMTLLSRYMPIVLLLTVLQYSAQLTGYLGIASFSRYE